jgi:pimeloyl-ACP methyl ester carboxylesterase
VDITTHLGPDFYSGVVFLGSSPFRSWNTEIMNPWLAGMVPRVLSTDLSDLGSTARDFVEAFAFNPDKLDPVTKFAWIGAYAHQHPAAKMNYMTRTQSEDALKSAVGKVPVLVLLGKGDKFLLPDQTEKLYKETFADAEVQVWPEVGHVPFFEEPEKTRDAILAFVKRVNKVRLSNLQEVTRVLSLAGLKITVDRVTL